MAIVRQQQSGMHTVKSAGSQGGGHDRTACLTHGVLFAVAAQHPDSSCCVGSAPGLYTGQPPSAVVTVGVIKRKPAHLVYSRSRSCGQWHSAVVCLPYAVRPDCLMAVLRSFRT